MSNPGTELEQWLTGMQPAESDQWLADFDVDRQVVIFKLGPFKRLFLRPQKFTQRFYHTLYPLRIETLPYRRQFNLFDGFCDIDMHLDLRFQVTLEYVQRNEEYLPDINQHIVENYLQVVDDIIARELQSLANGVWVQTGLGQMENRICNSLCELFTIQDIQAQALCHIHASFREFPNVEPGRNNVYLHVLKQTFELNALKNQEMIRQQRQQEQQMLTEKQAKFAYLQELTELELQEQALEAEKNQRLLTEKAEQLQAQRQIEQRIHQDLVSHQEQLRQISLESDLRFQTSEHTRRLELEARQLKEQLLHQEEQDEQKYRAEVQRRINARQREITRPAEPTDS